MKKVVIIANGEAPHPNFLKQLIKDADYIIAADGGIDICLKNEITADCLIGDLDSLKNTDMITNKTEMLHIKEQITTDMQKALNHAVELNPVKIEVCAAFGKRADHSFGNMLILNSFNSKPELIMHDGLGTFRILNPGTEQFADKNGVTLSLFSLIEISNILLTGFEYPLDKKKLPAPFLGVSNKICSDFASIKFDSGRLMVYELNALIAKH